MKNILVPVDYSENTANTINVACSFANQHQCGVVLLHSYFEMALAQSINTVTPDDIMPVIEPDLGYIKEYSEEAMKELVQKTGEKYPSLQINSLVTGLELKETIEEQCSQSNILMIVIGATGRGKKESFSGSTASSLFDFSPVPVLAIPDEYKYKGEKLGNILYATNFAEAAQTEVKFILDYFIRETNVLHCCHLRFYENDSLLDDAQMEVLSKPFDEEIKAGVVTFEIIDTNDTDETLSNLVETRKIELISFHEHNRGLFYHFFHKSIAKKHLYQFNIPLLVFRKF